jgi:hypothetical protein
MMPEVGLVLLFLSRFNFFSPNPKVFQVGFSKGCGEGRIYRISSSGHHNPPNSRFVVAGVKGLRWQIERELTTNLDEHEGFRC